MADNFDVADLALQSVAPGNKLLYDDKGLPSVMVFIPKFKMSEVIAGGSDEYHPMFRVDDQILDGIYISKYINVVENGRAYSLPGRDPKASINWDTARSYCEAKGDGWHMMTKAEYAGIALWCKANGFFPKGNNNYGKDTTETNYKAIPATYDADGKTLHTLTGTGPMTWNHNNAPDGIADINGNVSEWEGAFRTIYGELQFLPWNNGSNKSHDQANTSSDWKALDASTGLFITPDGNGTTTNSVKVNVANNHPQYSTTITNTSENVYGGIHTITCDDTISDACKLTLRAYGLLAEDGATAADYGDGDYLSFNNVADERVVSGGGSYYSGANAGVFYSFGHYYSRTNASGNIGFRSAYAPLDTAS